MKRHTAAFRAPNRPRAHYNAHHGLGFRSSAGDEIVLEYHWLESLRTRPPLPLERCPIPGDPIGFVRVRPLGRWQFVVNNEYSGR